MPFLKTFWFGYGFGYVLVGPTYVNGYYTAAILMQIMTTYTAVGPTYTNGYIHVHGSLSNANMAIYTPVAPSYEIGCIHGSRFQCKNAINGCRTYTMFI